MRLDDIEYMKKVILDGLPKDSGVYMILCKENGKCYIGSSFDINNRVKNHFNDLILDRHNVIELSKDFKEYGIENFEAVQLASCSDDLRNYIEGYYIKKYDSINRGYNTNNAGVSYHISNNVDNLIYGKPQDIKGEIDVLKNKCKEILNDNLDNAQVIGMNDLIKDYRLMIADCLNFKGLIYLIEELGLKVYIKSKIGVFYYQCDGESLRYILNGATFRCNEILSEEYEDLMTLDTMSVYIECPGFKNIEGYQEMIKLNNSKIEKEINELKFKEEKYINEYMDLTREINSMYKCRFDNKNYDDLLNLRKKCYLKLEEIKNNMIMISKRKMVDRSKQVNTDGFLWASLFKSFNKIINLK